MEFEFDINAMSYYKYLSMNKYRKYITKDGKEYKETLETKFKERMKNEKIIEENCSVDLVFYFNNRRKNDVDNFAKPILDAMSEIVYVDDKLIVDLRIRKYYSPSSTGRIIININPIT